MTIKTILSLVTLILLAISVWLFWRVDSRLAIGLIAFAFATDFEIGLRVTNAVEELAKAIRRDSWQ